MPVISEFHCTEVSLPIKSRVSHAKFSSIYWRNKGNLRFINERPTMWRPLVKSHCIITISFSWSCSARYKLSDTDWSRRSLVCLFILHLTASWLPLLHAFCMRQEVILFSRPICTLKCAEKNTLSCCIINNDQMVNDMKIVAVLVWNGSMWIST